MMFLNLMLDTITYAYNMQYMHRPRIGKGHKEKVELPFIRIYVSLENLVFLNASWSLVFNAYVQWPISTYSS